MFVALKREIITEIEEGAALMKTSILQAMTPLKAKHLDSSHDVAIQLVFTQPITIVSMTAYASCIIFSDLVCVFWLCLSFPLRL